MRNDRSMIYIVDKLQAHYLPLDSEHASPRRPHVLDDIRRAKRNCPQTPSIHVLAMVIHRYTLTFLFPDSSLDKVSSLQMRWAALFHCP